MMKWISASAVVVLLTALVAVVISQSSEDTPSSSSSTTPSSSSSTTQSSGSQTTPSSSSSTTPSSSSSTTPSSSSSTTQSSGSPTTPSSSSSTTPSSSSSTTPSSSSSTTQSSGSPTTPSSSSSTTQSSGSPTTQFPGSSTTQPSGASPSSVTASPPSSAETTIGAVTVSSSSDSGPSASIIRILLTSDLEYNIFPVHSGNHSLCFDTDSEEQAAATDCVGGLSRLAGYVDDNVNNFHLLVDAGNVAGRTRFPQLKFNPLTRVVERLNYTALAVDAELLMYGADAMQHGFLSSSAVAAVAANLDVGSTEVRKSRTVTWDDKCDVAVIGVVSSSRVGELSAPGVNASDEVSAVEQELSNLVNDSSGADKLITIVAGNIDENTAEAIANTTGVHLVIVSGANVSDSETDLSKLSSVVRQGNAFVVTLLRSTHLPFVLGDLELVVENSTCNVTDVKLTPVDYSAHKQTENAGVIELEKAGVVRLQQMTSRSLAVGTASLPSTGCSSGECALGNLVADAVVSQLVVQEQDAARLAVYPGHRFSNNTQLPTDVTGTAVDALFESDEFLYSLSLSGPQLKSLLEESVASSDGFGFLQISALMSVQFDLGRPEGSRVASVGVVSGDAVTFSAVNLTDSVANYSIAVPASMLWNLSVLQDVPRTFDLLSVSEAVKSYVLRAGVLVVPPAGSRVTYVDDRPVAPSTPAPTSPPAAARCPSSTATTVFVTLVVTAACVAGGALFWVYAVPRIRFFRARRDSSLPLVVQY